MQGHTMIATPSVHTTHVYIPRIVHIKIDL